MEQAEVICVSGKDCSPARASRSARYRASAELDCRPGGPRAAKTPPGIPVRPALAEIQLAFAKPLPTVYPRPLCTCISTFTMIFHLASASCSTRNESFAARKFRDCELFQHTSEFGINPLHAPANHPEQPTSGPSKSLVLRYV
jgi:hypothetical protein